MLIIISKTLPITTVKPTPNRNGRQRPFYGKTKKIDIHEKIITNPVLRRNTNNCRFRARLVIVLKNCCLKRCKNCGLKNIVKKRIFSVNKTKKYV